MFTIRTAGGVALFLFGTTFLWLTTWFASTDVSTTGVWWSIAHVLALTTLGGFSIATWGLFTRATWWQQVAIASAALGVLVLIPYWTAAHNSGETTPWFNVLIHALGDAGVLLLLLVPTLAKWVDTQVMARH